MPDSTTTTSYARTRRPMLDAPQRSRGRRSRALLVSLPMFAVFAAFGSIVWLAYVDRPDRPVGEPPLIQADLRPIKVPPNGADARELPAEGEVAELFTDRPPAQPERILPPPEEPILPGEIAPPQPAEAPDAVTESAPPADAAPPAEPPAVAEIEPDRGDDVAEAAPPPAPPPAHQAATGAPPSPPPDERAIFDEDCPDMGWAADVVPLVRDVGFELMGHFALPDEAWWDDFYTPMEARIAELRHVHAGDDEALAILDELATEPEMHRRHAAYYGYEFYVARRPFEAAA